jgi:hypothetical protein
MKSSFLRFSGVVLFGVALFIIGFSLGSRVGGVARAQAPRPQPSDSVPGGFHVRGDADVLQVSSTAPQPYSIGPCVAHKKCAFQIDIRQGKTAAVQSPCQLKATCLRFTSDDALAHVNDDLDSTHTFSITINLKK